MSQITIYGASDDLIGIDGDLREEFNVTEIGYIASSDGSLLQFNYDGCWRISPMSIATGTTYVNEQAVSEDDDNYSDRVTLTADKPFRWVAYSESCFVRKVGTR